MVIRIRDQKWEESTPSGGQFHTGRTGGTATPYLIEPDRSYHHVCVMSPSLTPVMSFLVKRMVMPLQTMTFVDKQRQKHVNTSWTPLDSCPSNSIFTEDSSRLVPLKIKFCRELVTVILNRLDGRPSNSSFTEEALGSCPSNSVFAVKTVKIEHVKKLTFF